MPGNPVEDVKNSDPDCAMALPPLPPDVAQGSLITVRGVRWRLATYVDHTDCRELHLQSADEAGRVLLWPFDRPVASGRRRGLRVVPLHFWTRCAGAALARTIDPRVPRVSFRGELLPYQIAPAIAMASGISRVLLADEVGLGKTIQAGWILADLLAREPGARALIAVPAGLRDQWAGELHRLFGVEVARVDGAWLRAAVASRAADVSPWAAPGVYLASIDFLKRHDVVPSLSAVVWDLLVVDEAHNAAAPTERHAMLARVAAASRRVVTITATPYSGDAAGFGSITSLGAQPGDRESLMFRRSREEVGDARRRSQRFIAVRIGQAEFRLQRLLERYTRLVWREAADEREAARLAMTVLRKRALSSPAAALRSLARRQDLLRDNLPLPQQLSLFDEDHEADEALPDAALATPGLADRTLEDRWLTTLIDTAARAAVSDSKAQLLRRLVARIGSESMVVFTEYRDTLQQLARFFPAALQLHGGLSSGERTAVQRTFNDQGGLLLATDAAAEGLNLQRRCRLMVNYELPWNPARLEQRIGRIDRIGQRRSVHAISLIARDTAEDLVVAALTRRLARVAETLGERDRLASLLTDARTAQCVIGGRATVIPTAAPAIVAPRRPSPDEYPLAEIARALKRPANITEPNLIAPVADIRTRDELRPGYAAVIRVTAITDAATIAERPVILHLPDATATRPRSRAHARSQAQPVVDLFYQAAPTVAAVREWFLAVSAIHRETTTRRLSRESWLRQQSCEPNAVQPGLFDRRVGSELDAPAETTGTRLHEHDRHLLRLGASLEPRLECAVAAVLIVWR